MIAMLPEGHGDGSVMCDRPLAAAARAWLTAKGYLVEEREVKLAVARRTR
jgi:hypothetical protein